MLYPSYWKNLQKSERIVRVSHTSIDGSEYRSLFLAITRMNRFLEPVDRIALNDNTSIEDLRKHVQVAVRKIREISQQFQCDVYYHNYILYGGNAKYIRLFTSLIPPSTDNGLPF